MSDYRLVVNCEVIAERRSVPDAQRAAVETELTNEADRAAATTGLPALLYRFEPEQPIQLVHAAPSQYRADQAADFDPAPDRFSAAVPRMNARAIRSEAAAVRAESSQARRKARQLKDAIEQHERPG